MFLHRTQAARVNSKCLILAYTSILITRFENDLYHNTDPNGTRLCCGDDFIFAFRGLFLSKKEHRTCIADRTDTELNLHTLRSN